MKTQLNIFVLIVTYKGGRWYDNCFSSLRESTIPVRTIVVDNTPGDEDMDYIRTHFPEIHIIKPKENLGFGRANNLAIRYALEHGCDYVFLLNQDTWLIDKNVFARLVDIAEHHPDYGIISPMHVQADGKTLQMMWEYKTNRTSVALFTDLYKNQLWELYETNYVNAAAWLLPRKTLEIVGGFDPIYTHYEEDDDYLNRVRYHQLKVGVCPLLKIVHDHQATINPFAKDKQTYHHNQELLVALTDVNQDGTICQYMCYFLRKYLYALLRWKSSEMQHWCKDLQFVWTHRNVIRQSRMQNRKNEASWI